MLRVHGLASWEKRVLALMMMSAMATMFFSLLRTPLETLFVFQLLEKTMKDYFLAAKV